ncbi:ribulose-phosphate 3-epimerase [Cyclobacterium xiamenense]|uniref:Ribulose-phosphate 3-epimerase n=1 Tax=Cyclobacterium xiamenense TaxID=1297121 RepID=A0A1H6UC50_9BACT|nr:ribulose-phosphate 3-epimerase [Cyclobacterium xiamenense]SEI89919.1 ribulose-phosphate 3-epimerase [Cyclobacterium xiamenense]
MNPLIAPSVLAADFANLQREVEMINESESDFIHVDIMDGVFVPNISMGLPVVEAINRHAKKPLDVHLMIVTPERYLSDFKKAGAAHITVHLEACPHLHRTVQTIKDLGCRAGVALNPHSPVSQLEDIIREVDIVLLMSVNPGFGGQSFIENTYAKVQKLKKLIVETGSHAKIEIDGGVSMENAKKLVDTGATILVAGNFVFSSKNPQETIKKLKNIG